MIDDSLGLHPPLADVEEFRLLARGMSEFGAYSMFLTDRTQGMEETLEALQALLGTGPFEYHTQERLDMLRQKHEGDPMLRRYQVFATGVGKDEAGLYTAAEEFDTKESKPVSKANPPSG